MAEAVAAKKAATPPPNRMGTDPIQPLLIKTSIPMVISMLVQALYNVVDSIYISQISESAVTALSLAFPIQNLQIGFAVGIGVGVNSLLSKSLGENNQDTANRAAGNGVFLVGVVTVLFALFGIFGARPYFAVQSEVAETVEGGAIYTAICCCGALGIFVEVLGERLLQSSGRTVYTLLTQGTGAVVNILLDPVFIFGVEWLGIPAMGIAGAAVATVLSQIISAVLVVMVLLRLPTEYTLQLSRIRIDPTLLKRILSVGVPAGLQFVTFDLANLLIQSGINSFGSATIAAFTAYGKTDALTWMVSGAFGVSITTFVGQNFGAGKYARIRKSVWVCMAMGIGLEGLLSALMLGFRVPILGIYTTDAEVIRIGAYMMLWIVPFNALFIPVEVFAGTMRGTGYSVMPTVITCTSVCLLRVLWVTLLVSRYHTIEMLCIVYPLSWVLASTVFLVVYLRGTWLKKRITACGMMPEG